MNLLLSGKTQPAILQMNNRLLKKVTTIQK
jgi:hypothetical protein